MLLIHQQSDFIGDEEFLLKSKVFYEYFDRTLEVWNSKSLENLLRRARKKLRSAAVQEWEQGGKIPLGMEGIWQEGGREGELCASFFSSSSFLSSESQQPNINHVCPSQLQLINKPDGILQIMDKWPDLEKKEEEDLIHPILSDFTTCGGPFQLWRKVCLRWWFRVWFGGR